MTEAIARDSLAYLFSVPQKTWIDVDDGPFVGFLCKRGLLLSDDDGGPFTGLRRRDEQLADLGWLPAAAVYHFATRFRGGDLNLAADDVEEFGDLAAASDAAARRFVERHGPPPPPFHSVRQNGDGVELPLVRGQGGLSDALAARKPRGASTHPAPDAGAARRSSCTRCSAAEATRASIPRSRS